MTTISQSRLTDNMLTAYLYELREQCYFAIRAMMDMQDLDVARARWAAFDERNKLRVEPQIHDHDSFMAAFQVQMAEFRAHMRDHSESLRHFWYSAQAFLSACARMSHLLWPDVKHPNRGETKSDLDFRRERGERLRAKLGITGASPLDDRNMRNDFEHFDERLDKWAKSTNGSLMTRCMGRDDGTPVPGLDPDGSLAFYDPTTQILTFQQSKPVHLLPMMRAVAELHNTLLQLDL